MDNGVLNKRGGHFTETKGPKKPANEAKLQEQLEDEIGEHQSLGGEQPNSQPQILIFAYI